jgi:hypothetical protein
MSVCPLSVRIWPILNKIVQSLRRFISSKRPSRYVLKHRLMVRFHQYSILFSVLNQESWIAKNGKHLSVTISQRYSGYAFSTYEVPFMLFGLVNACVLLRAQTTASFLNIRFRLPGVRQR